MFESYRERYEKISKEMVNIYVYVEGNDVLFYKNLKELSKITIYNAGSSENGISNVQGNSSSDVIKRVKEDRESGLKSFGIIDNDHHTNFDRYIYPIDFYCIENVALMNIEEFSMLRMSIYELIKEKIELYRICILGLEILKNEQERVESFNINKIREVTYDVKTYFENKVQCFDTFIRYMNLKELIVNFCAFYKQKFGKKNQIKYRSEDLAGKLPDKSLIYIFSGNTYKRFIEDIKTELISNQ